jgi:hypothetical protein
VALIEQVEQNLKRLPPEMLFLIRAPDTALRRIHLHLPDTVD